MDVQQSNGPGCLGGTPGPQLGSAMRRGCEVQEGLQGHNDLIRNLTTYSSAYYSICGTDAAQLTHSPCTQ